MDFGDLTAHGFDFSETIKIKAGNHTLIYLKDKPFQNLSRNSEKMPML